MPRTDPGLCASCDRCRARKTKCDGKRPCQACKNKYMKQNKLTSIVGINPQLFECVYSPAKRRRPVPGHKGSVSVIPKPKSTRKNRNNASRRNAASNNTNNSSSNGYSSTSTSGADAAPTSSTNNKNIMLMKEAALSFKDSVATQFRSASSIEIEADSIEIKSDMYGSMFINGTYEPIPGKYSSGAPVYMKERGYESIFVYILYAEGQYWFIDRIDNTGSVTSTRFCSNNHISFMECRGYKIYRSATKCITPPRNDWVCQSFCQSKTQENKISECEQKKKKSKVSKKKTCGHEGCTSWARQGGVCIKHGAKKYIRPNKKKSAIKRVGSPSKFKSPTAKRRIVNQFTAGGGGARGTTTPKSRRSNVLTPGTIRRTPASAIAVRDTSVDNDGMPGVDNLSQIDEPAFDTYSEYHWETLHQVTTVAEGYHHITINLDGEYIHTGLRFAYSSRLLRAVVTEILNGCPFADQIKVGDELVLVQLPNDSQSNAKQSMLWLEDRISRQPSSFVMCRKYIMDIPGQIAAKTRLYRLIKSSLENKSWSSTSIGTYQGKILALEDGTDEIRSSADGCAIISAFVCITHTQPSAEEEGVTTSQVKGIIDSRVPAFAYNIRRHKKQIQRRDVTDNDGSNNLSVLDITDYLRNMGFLSQLSAPWPEGGNVLLDDHWNRCILSPLSSGSGNMGMAFYFDKHVVTILRSAKTESTDTTFVYEFIEPLPSQTETNTLVDADRVTFDTISALETYLRHYCYMRLARLSNCEDIANKPWDKDTLLHHITDAEKDERIFSTYTFKYQGPFNWLDKTIPIEPPPSLNIQLLDRPDEPPKDTDPSWKDIQRIVDDLFYSGNVVENGVTPYCNAVLNDDSLGFTADTLSPQLELKIRSRLTALRKQTEDKLVEMIDQFYLDAENIDEDTSTIMEAICSRINSELSTRSISFINKRLAILRRGSVIRRYKKSSDGKILIEDGFFSSPAECVRNDTKVTKSNMKQLNAKKRVGGYVTDDGEYYYEFIRDGRRINKKQKLARMNGTEDEIQKITIGADNSISVESFTFNEVWEELDIEQSVLRKELKKGVYPQHNDPNGEYYRYKYPYYKANSYSRSHILARHLDDRRDTAVELLTLPDLEELDAYEKDTDFGDALVGIKRSSRWKKELQDGGFVLKHDGVHCFARYKYQHRPTITMLPRSAMTAKLLAVEFKNDKKLRKHCNADCVEMKTLVEGTGTMLEGILNDEDNMYHATPVLIEKFELTEDEKKKGHAYVKPACTIEDEGLKAMMDVKRQMHRDVFFTRRALHSYRTCNERMKHKPFAKMMLLEIDVSLEDCRPVGLTLGGHWRGANGIYKSANNAQIKKAIYIKTGSNGNISDDDAVIKLVRDDYNMKKVLSVNLRRDLNDHSDNYNNGLFHLNDDEEEENEEAIVEPTVNGMVVDDLPDQPAVEPAVQAALDDLIDKGTQNIIEGDSGDPVSGDVDLDFWELSYKTTRLGKKKLPKAIELAHEHWVNAQHGRLVTLRVFLKSDASNRHLMLLLGCNFRIDTNNRQGCICLTKEMGLLAY